MNTKLLIATIVGAIASFLLGWLVYGTLLMDFWKTNTTIYEGLSVDPPRLWAIFLGGLCYCFLLAWIFDKWSNTRDFKGGFINGMIISLPIMLWTWLGYYAFLNLYTSTLMITDIIVGTLFNGVVAGIIAAMLGRGKTAAA
ncbi:MAG: hypothetical protein ACHQNT_01180 [Bacteroidia bacterium]